MTHDAKDGLHEGTKGVELLDNSEHLVDVFHYQLVGQVLLFLGHQPEVQQFLGRARAVLA